MYRHHVSLFRSLHRSPQRYAPDARLRCWQQHKTACSKLRSRSMSIDTSGIGIPVFSGRAALDWIKQQARVSAAVKDAGGTVLPDGSGIHMQGWTIQAKKGPILKDADTDKFRYEIGGAKNTPEQLFANSSLQLQHKHTGLTVSFNAKAALQAWVNAKLPPVKVLSAQTWMSSREKDVAAHQAVPFDYDWTYTTDYAGSVAVDHSAEAGAVGAEPAWEPTNEGMDRSMLMARDPILFWDEIPLYESELDDNGVSQLRVKVRVMPKCWYVLLRFFLRVDKVLVKLRETRVFCPFSNNTTARPIIREIKFSEGTFEELSKAGAPADGAAYENADSAAMALQAVAPIGSKHLRSDKLVIKEKAVLFNTELADS